MKYKRIIGHEVIVFIACIGFGALVLPAVISVALSPFGVMSKAESLGDCYEILFQMLGGYSWLLLLLFFGPYVLVQIWRFHKGKLGRDYIENSNEDDDLFSFSKKVGGDSVTEFSGMSWRNFPTKDEDRSDTK